MLALTTPAVSCAPLPASQLFCRQPLTLWSRPVAQSQMVASSSAWCKQRHASQLNAAAGKTAPADRDLITRSTHGHFVLENTGQTSWPIRHQEYDWLPELPAADKQFFGHHFDPKCTKGYSRACLTRRLQKPRRDSGIQSKHTSQRWCCCSLIPHRAAGANTISAKDRWLTSKPALNKAAINRPPGR